MTTIKDVAQRAGVSTSTVSRALSGKIFVEKETKDRILQAVKDLGYQMNVLAKGLKEGKTNTVGLIIPNIENPIYPAVVRGVEDVTRKKGYTLILCNTDEDLSIELDYVDKMRKRWVDGLIFATGAHQSSHIEALAHEGFPTVSIIRDMGEKIDSITVENFNGAFDGVSYLAQRGHRRIAILNDRRDIKLFKERFAGYKQALITHGLDFDERLVMNTDDTLDTYAIVLNKLKSQISFDALFVTTDLMALTAMRAIGDFGLSVPRDISVMGFDGLEISGLIDPPLTTVAQPLYELGVEAGKRVIELIENRGNQELDIRQLTMPTKLIVRKSVR